MINKDPAFLFYSSDFLTGCMDLTMEERGQYITLICLQHQKGHLSEKTIRLCVGNISDDVMAKFKKDEEGFLYNARVEEEILKRQAFAESRRVNGSLGGRPKKPSGKPNDKPSEKPKRNLPENDNVNDNIDNRYGELGLVCLTSDQYNSLKSKHHNLDAAIEELDTWLGKESDKAKKALGKNHYAYFKSNSWVWERAGANNNTKPDPVELYLQIDNQKREEQQRLASAAEKAMELARQKAMSKFGG